MVFESSPPWQASSTNKSLSLRKTSAAFLQIQSEESGLAAREAISFFLPKARAVWIRKSWKIYAPLLWQWAQEKDSFLVGLEAPQAQKRRAFWQELYHSQSFDTWVIDQLPLYSAEAFFIYSLVRSSRLSLIFIQKPKISFCQKQLQISPSSTQTRMEWRKGKAPEVFHKSSPYLEYSFGNFYVCP